MRNNHVSGDDDKQKAFIQNFRGQSLRLPGHDYSLPGIYHIVACAKGVNGRGPLFAHPILRQLLQTNWLDLPLRYPSIYVEGLEVMPDHIHFIIWMNKWPERLQGKEAPPLWRVMQSYKSKVAVEWLDYLNKHHPNWPGKIWQPGYFDKIMKARGDLERARLYIRNNPDKEGTPAGWEAFYEHMGWEKPRQKPS